jgi:hypothetical protein
VFCLLVTPAHFGRANGDRQDHGKGGDRLYLSSACSHRQYFLHDLLQSDDPDAWNIYEPAQGDACREMYTPEELATMSGNVMSGNVMSGNVMSGNALGALGWLGGYMPEAGNHVERAVTHAYELLHEERRGRERKAGRPLYRSTRRAKTSGSGVHEETSRANTSKSAASTACRRHNGGASASGTLAARKQHSSCGGDHQDNLNAPLMHMRRAYGALLKIGLDEDDAEWQEQGRSPSLKGLGELCNARAVVDKLVLAHDVSITPASCACQLRLPVLFPLFHSCDVWMSYKTLCIPSTYLSHQEQKALSLYTKMASQEP